MENALLAIITVGIWMSDPSGCITYKPAALGLCTTRKSTLEQACGSHKQKITAQMLIFASHFVMFLGKFEIVALMCILVSPLQLSSRRGKWGWMTSSKSWCQPRISANSEYSPFLEICFVLDGKLAWERGTIKKRHLACPPSWVLYLFLIISPFTIFVHRPIQSATWVWQDNLCRAIIWAEETRVRIVLSWRAKNSVSTCLITSTANPLCPLDEDKPVIQLLHDTWLATMTCQLVRSGVRRTWTLDLSLLGVLGGKGASELSPVETQSWISGISFFSDRLGSWSHP